MSDEQQQQGDIETAKAMIEQAAGAEKKAPQKRVSDEEALFATWKKWQDEADADTFKKVKEQYTAEMAQKTDINNLVTKADMAAEIKKLNDTVIELKAFLTRAKAQGKAHIEEKEQTKNAEIMKIYENTGIFKKR